MTFCDCSLYSAGCRTVIVVLLASLVYSLVNEAVVEAYAVLWKVLVPADCWVKLGLVPLVGSAELRKTFSCLSAKEWDCVPILLVAWLEVSQH